MTEYRRANIAGASWFFTVNLAERRGNRLLVDNVDLLRQVFRKVRRDHPFKIDAIVVLPEHLHCIWTLPDGDSNDKTGWALIKAGFSREIPAGEMRSKSRIKRFPMKNGVRSFFLPSKEWGHHLADWGQVDALSSSWRSHERVS